MNWFAYRLPGDEENIITGASRECLINTVREGFIIYPFDNTIHSIVTITDEGLEPDWGIYPASSNYYKVSTTEDQHRQCVESVLQMIERKELGKCIVARIDVRNKVVKDLKAVFLKLAKAYPSAYVFAFSSDATGTWIGASPELLLKKRGDELETMALAGTRKKNTHLPWDEKNCNEQAIVSKFIAKEFKGKGIVPIIYPVQTRAAGPVEHLCTVIKGKEASVDNALGLAFSLSPTPALSGFPKDKAIVAISRTEEFDRKYYGGFCGELKGNGDFDFFVNLRSAFITSSHICSFAGGGIIEGSESEKEWEETESKLATLKNFFE